MKLVFAPEALADIEEIYRHVSSQSLQMAEKIEVAIRLASERCASTPYIYPATARKSVRRYPLRRYGFLLTHYPQQRFAHLSAVSSR